MGQRITISETEKNRIKGLYEQTPVASNERIPGRESMQQLRQTQRADRQQTRQDQRIERRATRQNNRAIRRDVRAEQAAVADIMNLRNEFNTLMTNLNSLSKHQNTETYQHFQDLITNTAASLKGFVDSTVNAGQVVPPSSEEEIPTEQ